MKLNISIYSHIHSFWSRYSKVFSFWLCNVEALQHAWGSEDGIWSQVLSSPCTELLASLFVSAPTHCSLRLLVWETVLLSLCPDSSQECRAYKCVTLWNFSVGSRDQTQAVRLTMPAVGSHWATFLTPLFYFLLKQPKLGMWKDK